MGRLPSQLGSLRVEGRVLWWFLTKGQCDTCHFLFWVPSTQAAFIESRGNTHSLSFLCLYLPSLVRSPWLVLLQMPAVLSQLIASRRGGPPTLGPPVPMLGIAPRLSCPHAHWTFLILEFLRLAVDWISVCHQSSYVKILTTTWWY